MANQDDTFARFARRFAAIEAEIPARSFGSVAERARIRGRPAMSAYALGAALVVLVALIFRSLALGSSAPGPGAGASTAPASLEPAGTPRAVTAGGATWTVACDGAADADCDGAVALFSNNLARDQQMIFDDSGGRLTLHSRTCPTFGGLTARQCWDVTALIANGSMCMVVASGANDPRYPAYFEIGGQDGTGRAGGPPSGWPMCLAPPLLPAPTTVPTAGGSIDALGVSPSGAIWIVSGNLIAISTDVGSSWTRAAMPPPESTDQASPTFVLDAVHAWVITVTPGSVESGNGPTFDHVHLIVNRTIDGGRTWETANVPGDYPDTARSIVFVDARHGYLMVSGGRTNGGSSTILRSDDAGATWTTVQTIEAGDQGSLGSLVSVLGDATIWAAAQGEAGPVNHPILAVSRDSGRTWATVELPGVLSRWGGTQNLPLGPPSFLSSDVGMFALTSSDEATTGDASGNPRTLVYSTADLGRTWTQPASLAFDVNGPMAFLSATSWIAVVAGVPSTLEITTDGGATWRAVHSSGVPTGSFQQVAAVGGNRLLGLVLIGGNSGDPQVLALSSDGGLTWQAIHQ